MVKDSRVAAAGVLGAAIVAASLIVSHGLHAVATQIDMQPTPNFNPNFNARFPSRLTLETPTNEPFEVKLETRGNPLQVKLEE